MSVGLWTIKIEENLNDAIKQFRSSQTLFRLQLRYGNREMNLFMVGFWMNHQKYSVHQISQFGLVWSTILIWKLTHILLISLQCQWIYLTQFKLEVETVLLSPIWTQSGSDTHALAIITVISIQFVNLQVKIVLQRHKSWEIYNPKFVR